MSKCLHCELEFSDSVLSIHQVWCAENAENQEDVTENEELIALRKKAESLGVKNWQKKKESTLLTEIKAIEEQGGKQ
jgi:hypothetical protein